jgi:hypothetical protein
LNCLKISFSPGLSPVRMSERLLTWADSGERATESNPHSQLGTY